MITLGEVEGGEPQAPRHGIQLVLDPVHGVGVVDYILVDHPEIDAYSDAAFRFWYTYHGRGVGAVALFNQFGPPHLVNFFPDGSEGRGALPGYVPFVQLPRDCLNGIRSPV